jgi:hypothetical protein
MSIASQTIIGLAQKGPAVIVMRNLKSCLFWLALLSISCCVFFLISELRTLAAGLFLFTLQALVAEWSGVRISDEAVSAPRRLLLFKARLVFWRSQGSLSDIESLTSISRASKGEIVHLRWMHGTTIQLVFENRDRKRKFFQTMLKLHPNVDIYRDDP